MKRKAFTLIELLTVMAITAVMLTLIVLPLFQSFQLTRTAQAFADAQDKGRGLIGQISREVGNAVSVRSASSTVIQLPAIDSVTRVPLNNGTFDENLLPYSKLDLVPPAQGVPDPTLPAGTFRDPDSGKIDPTMTRPRGDINLNVVPGQTLVRYWIGIRDPAKPYNEPYTGLLVARNGDRDNLAVLRRAEVQPFVYRPIKSKSQQRPFNPNDATLQMAWRPNLDYFRSDDVTDTRIVDLDDPKFFIPDGQYLPESTTAQPNPVRTNDPGNAGLQVPGKNERVARWAALGTKLDGTAFSDADAPRTGESVIQTDVSRYDMIRPIMVGSPPQVDKSADPKARVVPLIQFRPTRVAAEPAAGSAAARPGEAVEGLDRIGPDTYKTGRGLWSNAYVRYYPGSFAPGDATNGLMEVANVNPLGVSVIEAGTASAAGLDTGNGVTLFDLNAYERSLSLPGAYSFSAATNTGPLADDATRKVFTPFRVLTASGKIVSSFPIDQVGGHGTNSELDVNLPYVRIKDSLTPAQDPTATKVLTPLTPGATESGRDPNYDPNHAFNYAWNNYPELQGVLQRFIDLRMLANADSTLSPLCPIAPSQTSQLTGFSFPNELGSATNRVRIVPGSDEVYGPDQTPSNVRLRADGTPFAPPTVRYTRVTGNPGPNQYRLVYADLAEPTNATTGQVDYSVFGFTDATVMRDGGSLFSPTGYNANNVVSTMIQPRFKAGYLQLESDPNLPIPIGRIIVKYRFQFTGPTDTFAVDLDTREVMQILLTVKNYPQSSAPNAQTVTLKATATLRNALR